MRNLALLLVLLNLAFAAWHAWIAAPPRGPRVPAVGRAVPELMLASELPPAAAPAVETPAAAVAEPAVPALEAAAPAEPPQPAFVPSQRCVSVGPFRELSQAAAAAGNLRAAGYLPEQRVAEGDIWVGYWVYLAGIPTRQRANEILADLQQHGITDSYVTPGDDGFLISLGVFSEVSRAGTRREEVRALGQEPNVVDRTRRGTVYWIDLQVPAAQTLDLETLQTPGRITRLEQRSCDLTP
jgi:hypothetical protein